MKKSTMKFVWDGYKMLDANEMDKELEYERLLMKKEFEENEEEKRNNKLHPMMGILYTLGIASYVYFGLQFIPIIAKAISTTVLSAPIPLVSPIILI